VLVRLARLCVLLRLRLLDLLWLLARL